MTYNVFGGTLSLTQSINQPDIHQKVPPKALSHIRPCYHFDPFDLNI